MILPGDEVSDEPNLCLELSVCPRYHFLSSKSNSSEESREQQCASEAVICWQDLRLCLITVKGILGKAVSEI